MSNRWKMNRIGFVNFWLYDEEDFWFEDGKLLLRGQNGSGKSITTQSFIPFILDGDRTPSRLDPFGSSDRRMEYYFLGEEGKEESTGYLFLEFRKEHTEEYRTIGIGQHARRGKPMDFWGFVILDGRRVGEDIWLYRQTGSVKIPYDKRDMKQALGEENLFTDSPSEYKKLVNRSIFGFRKMEQYEQFIRLLVKVRAPKLSKEFKPTRVYEILNDSLQTLTDEDLRTMVDAMEKMDEIQDSLETLKRAFGDVKIIRTEYTRYNQFMLARKAQSYLNRRDEVETARRHLEELQEKVRELEQSLKENSEELTGRREQERLVRTEREGLLDTDLEDMDRKLGQARREQQEVQEREVQWKKKAEDYNGKIFLGEQARKRLQEELEQRREELRGQRDGLSGQQEILQWQKHEEALRLMEQEQTEGAAELARSLGEYGKQLEEALKIIRVYEEVLRRYDQLASRLEHLQQEYRAQEEARLRAEKEVTSCQEQWIFQLYETVRQAVEWKPEKQILEETENRVLAYQTIADAGAVQELLRGDYERQRLRLLGEQDAGRREMEANAALLEQARADLLAVQSQEELEPEREESTECSRRALRQAGIHAVPFYQAVEFDESVDEKAGARLEAQLKSMGLLDALVVLPEDIPRIGRECPEFLDSIIYVEKAGNSTFSDLTVNEELEPGLKREVGKILSNIRPEAGTASGLVMGADGSFCQGILRGRAGQSGEAEFVGQLARRRKKERMIRQLTENIREREREAANLQEKLAALEKRVDTLDSEYRGIPAFTGIHEALQRLQQCELQREMLERQLSEAKQEERKLAEEKNQRYQTMLKSCKAFPYGRTESEYESAGEALKSYSQIWQECRDLLGQMRRDRESLLLQEDRIAQDEEAMEDALAEMRRLSIAAKECGIRIARYEEYLNRPEIREKAGRIRALGEKLEQLEKEIHSREAEQIRQEERLEGLKQSEPQQKEALLQAIGEETWLRKYFEEELALKLVFERESSPLPDCARRALGFLREQDKNREPAEMLQALYQVFQKHNGSLANYGTTLEECFGAAAGETESEGLPDAVRKRVRVASVWNGKKVYLEEFYQILKAAIEETELLIQEKDRELFEDILSQTISQQLTDRIAESRRWVADMSRLMRDMDTSMGLRFSLEWKPRTAENDAELDVAELEQILLRDRALLTMEDIEKVAAHFRSKIRTEKLLLEENGGMVNYMELVRDAMDYRRWFSFQMFYRRGEEPRKPLTNAAFNRFSGGEKAMAMYVPLFAAVNAQYKKTDKEDHPRIIALDEAFAGVDDKNISSMFELVHKLDFDYIMNSQALWGCYDTVKGLRIAELLRPLNSQVVTVIRYTWNGHERILDEQ